MKAIYLTVISLVLFSAAFGEKLEAAYAEALIRSTGDESSLTGKAGFEDSEGGLKITAEIENVSPGDHGFHVHEFGSCAEAGKAAGDHYNPAHKPHGLVTEDGLDSAHAGDFGNIQVGDDGKGSIELVVPGLTVDKEFAVAGRSLIIHEKADQFTQPLGDAGGRIGCGTIYIVKGQ